MAYTSQPLSPPDESFPFHGTLRYPTPRTSPGNRVPLAFWLLFWSLASTAMAFLCYAALRSVERTPEKPLRFVEHASTLGLANLGNRLPEAPNETVIALKEPPVEEAPVEEPPPPPPVMEPVPAPMPLPPPQPMPPAEPVTVDFPKIDVPTMEPPPLPVLPPVAEVRPPVEATEPVVNLQPLEKVPEETDLYPVVFTRAAHPGESPMLRNWNMLALYSLTVITITQPAPVVAQEKDDVRPLVERFDKLDKMLSESFKNLGDDMSQLRDEVTSTKNQITKVQTDLSSLRGQILTHKVDLDKTTNKVELVEGEIAKLRDELEVMKKRMETLPSKAVAATPILDKADLDDLKAKLGAIEKAILGLQPSQSRVALSPPATTGRVMLVNNYPEDLLFVINGRSYRVPPGTTQPLESEAAGALNYEVVSPTWGSRARKTTTLGAGETFTLTAQ